MSRPILFNHVVTPVQIAVFRLKRHTRGREVIQNAVQNRPGGDCDAQAETLVLGST
jgi:hypothetical protein